MLRIEIDTGNAAFSDPYTSEKDTFYEAIELKRILEGICEKLEDNEIKGNIFDINGNKVGTWSREE